MQHVLFILIKARVFFQCRNQHAKILFSRNFDGAELSNVIVDNLRVEQSKTTRNQMPNKESEADF